MTIKRSRSVIIYGNFYPTIRAASIALDVSPRQVKLRIESKLEHWHAWEWANPFQETTLYQRRNPLD